MPSEITDKKPGKKKGAPKTGGREKGTPNRSSKSVLAELDRIGVPIVEALISDLQMLEPYQRIPFWFALMHFCFPRLKEIDPPDPTPPPSDPAPEKPSLAGLSREELHRLARQKPEEKADA